MSILQDTVVVKVNTKAMQANKIYCFTCFACGSFFNHQMLYTLSKSTVLQWLKVLCVIHCLEFLWVISECSFLHSSWPLLNKTINSFPHFVMGSYHSQELEGLNGRNIWTAVSSCCYRLLDSFSSQILRVANLAVRVLGCLGVALTFVPFLEYNLSHFRNAIEGVACAQTSVPRNVIKISCLQKVVYTYVVHRSQCLAKHMVVLRNDHTLAFCVVRKWAHILELL